MLVDRQVPLLPPPFDDTLTPEDFVETSFVRPARRWDAGLRRRFLTEDGESACELGPVPDAVLLRVFRSLDDGDLLRARGVCRRWRRVARSWAAWRDRSHAVTAGPATAAVLLRAPCLRSLVVAGGWRCPAVAPGDMRCAAAKLVLEDLDSDVDLGLIDVLLRRMVALGRLTSVEMVNCRGDRSLADVFRNRCVRLDTLVVRSARPSGESQKWTVQENTEDGATPRPAGPPLPCSTASTVPAVLIANNCGNLRRLTCSALEDLWGLTGLHSLKELELVEDGEGGRRTEVVDNLSAAENLAFFEQATHLGHLGLHLGASSTERDNAVLDALELLASTRTSKLTSLTLSMPEWPRRPAFWRRLGEVVVQLTHLANLELDLWWGRWRGDQLPPAEFFQRVGPQRLQLRLPVKLRCPGHGLGSGGSGPESVLLQQLQALAAAVPGLHLTGIQVVCEELRHGQVQRGGGKQGSGGEDSPLDQAVAWALEHYGRGFGFQECNDYFDDGSSFCLDDYDYDYDDEDGDSEDGHEGDQDADEEEAVRDAKIVDGDDVSPGAAGDVPVSSDEAGLLDALVLHDQDHAAVARHEGAADPRGDEDAVVGHEVAVAPDEVGAAMHEGGVVLQDDVDDHRAAPGTGRGSGPALLGVLAAHCGGVVNVCSPANGDHCNCDLHVGPGAWLRLL